MHFLSTRLLISAVALLPAVASAQGDASTTGGPANLCQELVAFVRQPVASMKAVETPAQQATAVTARKSGEPSEKPSASGTPQNTSGMSGQITASGPGAAGPQGAAQNKAVPEGSTATASGPAKDAPITAPAAPRPSTEDVRHVEDAAGANDLVRCRDVAQAMRRAGVAMPAPLLALSAMSPQLLEAAPRP
ncbi:hypothetical protein PMNALOAF_0477 [Methylobacterium adhaesivum]|uniref:Secreted protein n=1 Tax=Methylobacterium adhaesivum TaxID=333297 RepID=A0ABT8BDK3_9HYPH|nr:hypothetical protein [Methylobacterium adhaesivum]MDN3590177.1 hypothetical protein [Methylobacterium adhaesivum]GJD29245.1 hypothetical protein PMNALOAF_0477 [Methylobacterium adhaesivum]